MEIEEKTTKQSSFMNTTSVQLGLIVVLVLFLLIPLEYVKFLTSERQEREREVVHEIADKWGGEVIVYGPILNVPYKKYVKSKRKNEEGKFETVTTIETHNAYFLPNQLNIESKVQATNKNRGIYEAVVFKSDLNFSGDFEIPDFASMKIKTEDVLWNEAKLIVKTSSLKSIRDEIKINFEKDNYTFEPVYTDDHNRLKLLQSKEIGLGKLIKNQKYLTFNMDLSYNGSQSLQMVPVGKTSSFSMESNWKDPSFSGEYLPMDKSISEKGFTANWKILDFNRAFPQSFFQGMPNLEEYTFGVNFINTIDQYQQNERSSKYGLLVIGLTFLTFFMIQVVNKLKIHIIEYTMIGAAMVLFYTLLLSITEHLSFSIAYLISASAVILLVSLYSYSLLKQRKLLFFVAGTMALLYAYIYVIIQMENYALLSGSVGLFIILSIIMYFSRKIDWQK
jgi:inner membrane protein